MYQLASFLIAYLLPWRMRGFPVRSEQPVKTGTRSESWSVQKGSYFEWPFEMYLISALLVEPFRCGVLYNRTVFTSTGAWSLKGNVVMLAVDSVGGTPSYKSKPNPFFPPWCCIYSEGSALEVDSSIWYWDSLMPWVIGSHHRPHFQ